MLEVDDLKEGGVGCCDGGKELIWEEEETLICVSWIWVGCLQWMGAVLDLLASLCGEDPCGSPFLPTTDFVVGPQGCGDVGQTVGGLREEGSCPPVTQPQRVNRSRGSLEGPFTPSAQSWESLCAN